MLRYNSDIFESILKYFFCCFEGTSVVGGPIKIGRHNSTSQVFAQHKVLKSVFVLNYSNIANIIVDSQNRTPILNTFLGHLTLNDQVPN